MRARGTEAVTLRRVLAVAALTLAALGLSTRPAAAQCSISATGVAFGSYDVFTTTPTDSTGTITYRCTLSLNVQITLSQGIAGDYNPRQLASGPKRLNYNLYRNAARTTIWGNGSGGTSVYTHFVPLLTGDIVVTVYGRIFALQDVPAGSYSDTIVVTINF